MKVSKSVLSIVVSGILGFAVSGTHAATVMYSAHLSITSGVAVYDANGYLTSFTSGSYFGVDTNANNKISDIEKTPLSEGTTGIIIGQPTSQGASHTGEPTAGDTNEIDAPWKFYGNTGSTYTTIGITGGTISGLDMSGWKVTWAGINEIPLGTGAWQTATGTGHTGATGTFTHGIANFYWSGVYGDSYSLDYRATVPLGHYSGFGGSQWEWHLEGFVNYGPLALVPIPAALWLFGSGLLGLIGVGRGKITRC